MNILQSKTIDGIKLYLVTNLDWDIDLKPNEIYIDILNFTSYHCTDSIDCDLECPLHKHCCSYDSRKDEVSYVLNDYFPEFKNTHPEVFI